MSVIALLLAMSQKTSKPLADVVVTTQPKVPIHLRVGQRLVFRLAGNAGPGGNWALLRSGDPGLRFEGLTVRPLSAKPSSRPQAQPMVFVAVKRGTYFVKLVFNRPAEARSSGQPWQTRSAKVIIR